MEDLIRLIDIITIFILFFCGLFLVFQSEKQTIIIGTASICNGVAGILVNFGDSYGWTNFLDFFSGITLYLGISLTGLFFILYFYSNSRILNKFYWIFVLANIFILIFSIFIISSKSYIVGKNILRHPIFIVLISIYYIPITFLSFGKYIKILIKKNAISELVNKDTIYGTKLILLGITLLLILSFFDVLRYSMIADIFRSFGIIFLTLGYVFFGDRENFLGLWNKYSRIEKQLFEKEQLYKTLVETTPNLIFKFNIILNHFDYINPSVQNILGFTQDEIINTNPSSIVPIESLQDFNQIIEKIEKGETVKDFRLKFITKNGKTLLFNINAAPYRSFNQIIEGFLVIGNDITLLDEYQNHLKLKISQQLNKY